MSGLLLVTASLAELLSLAMQTIEKLPISDLFESSKASALKELHDELIAFCDTILVFEKWALYSKGRTMDTSSLASSVAECSQMIKDLATKLDSQVSEGGRRPSVYQKIMFPESEIRATIKQLQSCRETMLSIIRSSRYIPRHCQIKANLTDCLVTKI